MPFEPLLLVRILYDFQHLFVVMTVNSVVPFFADHEFCARRPPFGHEVSISDLPMMPFIRYPQIGMNQPLTVATTSCLLANVRARRQQVRAKG